MVKFWPKTAYLHPVSWTKWRILIQPIVWASSGGSGETARTQGFNLMSALSLAFDFITHKLRYSVQILQTLGSNTEGIFMTLTFVMAGATPLFSLYKRFDDLCQNYWLFSKKPVLDLMSSLSCIVPIFLLCFFFCNWVAELFSHNLSNKTYEIKIIPTLTRLTSDRAKSTDP